MPFFHVPFAFPFDVVGSFVAASFAVVESAAVDVVDDLSYLEWVQQQVVGMGGDCRMAVSKNCCYPSAATRTRIDRRNPCLPWTVVG